MGVERPKTYTDMTYLKKKNIDKAIHQKLRNKDVYETDMAQDLQYYCESDKKIATG